jgi:hypothetical protein
MVALGTPDQSGGAAPGAERLTPTESIVEHRGGEW